MNSEKQKLHLQKLKLLLKNLKEEGHLLGMSGKKHSAETKQKIGKSMKGKAVKIIIGGVKCQS